MTIPCAERIITPEQAGAIACAEHPDLLTRLVRMAVPGLRKETRLLEIEPFYCKYYVSWGVVSGGQGKRVRCAAAMNSALNLVRKAVGTPEARPWEAQPGQIARDRYSQEQAEEKIREFMLRSAYKTLRGLGSVSLEHTEAVYRPFYVCLCERGGTRYRRIVDAMLGERDYLLEYQYKNLRFSESDAVFGGDA